ncbi:1-phosphofructokinase [Marinilactibacillus piezotolerans]|uniref:1-phosphofructokinase n=1 Tax=Marinilactibacillus piezotolerans TaxID=258723 RepID=UPI0009B0F12D|nr:1-phosphofructokinase [Marinilactibacillus piezotolerans]
MIYTVTLNPSIDYVVYMKDEVKPGGVNRIQKDRKFPGGKGINVSRILTQLDIENKALGFIGGFTGNFIEEALKQEQINTGFVQVEEDTRINVKVKSSNETEINGPGPHISEAKAKELLDGFSQLTDQDVVILSGSKSAGLPSDYYQQVIQTLKQTGAQFVLDTTGKELQDALASGPLLIKPNNHELEELFNVTLETEDDLVFYGKKLVDAGAQNVIISMAEKGAMLFTEKGVYHGKAPKGQLKNSVGAGDSMVAGFTGVFTKTNDPLEAFKYGIASGSATAFEEDLATRDKIEALLPQIDIQAMEEN